MSKIFIVVGGRTYELLRIRLQVMVVSTESSRMLEGGIPILPRFKSQYYIFFRMDGEQHTDCEALYCLVFGCASRAVAASDGLDVATALLVTSAVIPLSVLHNLLKLKIGDEGYSYLDARFLTILADSERKRLVSSFSTFSHGNATH